MPPPSDRATSALGRAADALSRASDLDALLAQVLAAARDAIPATEKGSILFWDEVFQTLHVSHTIGYADPRADKATCICLPCLGFSKHEPMRPGYALAKHVAEDLDRTQALLMAGAKHTHQNGQGLRSRLGPVARAGGRIACSAGQWVASMSSPSRKWNSASC